ncbi:glycosyltransferase [Aquimarina sp. 2201CG1-2-11]|uniref:glycosyltransferase n=1 Tax=Aquimarina discodermiae TaxID=3231043 RepID=UPI003462F552
MKIVLVIPTFLSGGMERVMSELANHWAHEGVHVDLIFLVDHEPFYQISEKLNSVSMPSFGYKKNVLSKLFYKVKLLFYLRRKYKNLNPDVVLSFGEGYNLFVILSTLGTKKKIYVANRSNPFKKLPFMLKMFEKVLYPIAEGIFVQTSLAKEVVYNKIKHENIKVIPNPIKVIPKAKVEQKNIILNVGRLVPEKDQANLIKIFYEMNLNDWELHIVGDGPLRNNLEKLIEEYGLQSRVKLLGSKKDLSPYFSQSKIFAFSSISEGYPNALCEAMAFPLACISFDCDAGPRDIIKDGMNGFLIEKNNVENYKAKLLQLIHSEELRNNFSQESVRIRDAQSIKEIGHMMFNSFES